MSSRAEYGEVMMIDAAAVDRKLDQVTHLWLVIDAEIKEDGCPNFEVALEFEVDEQLR